MFTFVGANSFAHKILLKGIRETNSNKLSDVRRLIIEVMLGNAQPLITENGGGKFAKRHSGEKDWDDTDFYR